MGSQVSELTSWSLTLLQSHVGIPEVVQSSFGRG